MAGLRQYIYSIATAAMFCGLICSLIKDGTGGRLLRLLCGIFMTLTLLRPLVNLQLPDMTDYLNSVRRSAEAEVSRAEELSRAQKEAIIKAETEAYIQDKASEIGLEIRAEVILEDGIPGGALLRGIAEKNKKDELIRILSETLGIPKEQIRWSS